MIAIHEYLTNKRITAHHVHSCNRKTNSRMVRSCIRDPIHGWLIRVFVDGPFLELFLIE